MSGTARKTRRITFTADEQVTLIHCIRIAEGDGSIFGGATPGDAEWLVTEAVIDRLLKKFRAQP